MSLLPGIDALLAWLLVTRASYSRELHYHALRSGAPGIAAADVVSRILNEMALLNAKCTALLQYAAIGLLSLTLVFVFAPHAPLRGAAAVLIVMTAICAVLVLRCMDAMGPRHMRSFQGPRAYRREAIKEMIVRRAVYGWALRAVILVSAAAAALFAATGVVALWSLMFGATGAQPATLPLFT